MTSRPTRAERLADWRRDHDLFGSVRSGEIETRQTIHSGLGTPFYVAAEHRRKSCVNDWNDINEYLKTVVLRACASAGWMLHRLRVVPFCLGPEQGGGCVKLSRWTRLDRVASSFHDPNAERYSFRR